jgi:predicted nucleotidyltransferase component of viral defense system
MSKLLQSVEQFHLAFLEQLGRKLDKRLYILKGGCNLRFYFKSIRYSEDIDLDVWKISKDTLFKNVQQILIGPALKSILQSRGITITTTSAPKQTTTTQRWKIELSVEGISGVHTKIEFSRREHQGSFIFEAIDASIIGCYHFAPILSQHYDRKTAIKQKIFALANRNVTQARDIFDLYLLLSGYENGNSFLRGIEQKEIAIALVNLDSIKFQDFQSQVVAFLDDDCQNQYSTKGVWELIAENIKKRISGEDNK